MGSNYFISFLSSNSHTIWRKKANSNVPVTIILRTVHDLTGHHKYLLCLCVCPVTDPVNLQSVPGQAYRWSAPHLVQVTHSCVILILHYIHVIYMYLGVFQCMCVYRWYVPGYGKHRSYHQSVLFWVWTAREDLRAWISHSKSLLNVWASL